MKELSNCPFCGGAAKVMTFFDPYVTCTKCGSSGIVCEEIEEAVEVWNLRHEPTIAQANDPILEASDWLCELRILIDEYGAAAAIEGKGALPRHVNRIMKHARAYPFSPLPRAPRTEVAGAVPAGWKLVPVAPTGNMVHAASITARARKTTAELYAAMLAAAPQPPSADAAAAPADAQAALRDMLDDARDELTAIREALGVAYEPHQTLFERTLDAARAAASKPAAEPTIPAELHHDTAKLVRRFAHALANKLLSAQRKYGYSDNWMRDDWADECRAELMRHIQKGDPRDVAAYCAFLWHHNESTAAAAGQEAVAFIRDVAAQTPEKPDHWNSCGQCQCNAERAQDLLDAATQGAQGEKGANDGCRTME